jgi:hypothetical protein
MPRFAKNVALFSLVVAFSVFFGIDLADRGIARVHGPVSATAEAPVVPTVRQPSDYVFTPSSAPVKENPARRPTPEPVSAVAEVSPINRIANKTGELLQILAYHGIRWVVALFDGLLG